MRGFVDAHNHLFSNEAFGGRLICGKVFSTSGIADALKDCPEHYPDGSLALFDYITHGGDGKHDPVGYPTFKDWPAYDSMTHQANYYAWIERAWRGGQRVLVNDLVTNGMICSIYPFKDRSCDEMTSIRLQAKLTYAPPGLHRRAVRRHRQGLVPDRHRQRAGPCRSIAQGKLAVVLGVETSEPFGCKQILDIAQCSKADIDKGLDELYGLGVRSMFLCHKFDNALCGVRFDEHGLGTAINVGQFLSTGTFWQTEKCKGPQKDNPIGDGVHGGRGRTCRRAPRCRSTTRTRSATSGGSPISVSTPCSGMMKRKMMLEIDHMSVKATGQTLDMFEAASYPGVLSSHSWMDLNWTERVYSLGGFVAQYMHGSEEFSTEAKRTDALRTKYHVGYGYGTDFNGIGDHPAPRGAATSNPVTYPFKSVDGGSTIDKQTTGTRTFDYNTDGAAHVGMIPDWIEDIRLVGGPGVVDDLFKGAESYLDTWGSSESHQAGVNLAKGVTATASSSESNPVTSYQPGRAVDGDSGTRWASDWSDDQWLKLDLGSSNA